MNHGMTYSAELAFSMLLSPQELVVWNAMGAAVHDKRVPEMMAEVNREQEPPPAQPSLAEYFRVEMARYMKEWGGTIRPDAKRRPRRDLARPCVIEGVSYPSRYEAARLLDRDMSTISRWATQAEQGREYKVFYRGKGFRSIAAAARTFGLPFSTMRRRIRGTKFEQQGQGAENGARQNGRDTRQRLTA